MANTVEVIGGLGSATDSDVLEGVTYTSNNGIKRSGTFSPTAGNISYDNTESGLSGATVQAVINEINENLNGLDAVSYDIAQELTDEQKIQARANIGAGEPQVQSDLSQTDEAASDYVKGVIRQESLPEGYPYEEVREVVILPETEFSTVYAGRDSRDSITVDSNFKFEDGIEYIITFNGAKYICKRNVYNEITFLGNAYISYNILPGNPFDGMDTNEPFMIFIKDSEPTTLYINTINPIDCSVSIVYDDSITHAIDYKYMPEGYPYEEVTATNISGQEYEITGFTETSLSVTHNLNIPFELGQIWSAGLETLSYECEVQAADDGTLYIGSIGASSTPFYITANDGEVLQAYMNNHSNASTFYLQCVSGTVTETTIHPMDEKFLPSSATAQSDWSVNDENDPAYVKNRTHYDSREIVSTILGGDSATLPEASYELNKEYKVQFGDTEYTCTIQRYYLSPVGCDMYILGGNPWSTDGYSEYPFSIVIGKSTESIENIAATINVPEAPASPITVSILFGGELKQLDPKYIKGMYYEEPLEVFSVGNAEFTDGQYACETPFVIIDGNTYIVNWDGIEYICVAYTFEGIPAIGNTSNFGGKGNGEPFCIAYNSATNETAIGAYDDATTHTVSVVENIVHTIDHKYIKDMYYDNGSTTTVLVDNQTVTGFEVMEDPIYAVKNPFSFAPVVGATYTVTWDGTDYECTASAMFDITYIGNINYLFMQSGGDIPFAIVFDEDIFLVTESTEESHTISITEVVHDMKQLDEKYLPILEEGKKTAFSMDGVINGNEYESSNGMLTGVCRVTVDGVSEDIEFVNDIGYSWAIGSSYYIETLDYGIYFEFQDDEPHSVKIEIPVNVIKEEYLPDSITATPNWNAAEGEDGYIENRTHYEAGERTLISKFDKDTNKMTPAKYLKDTEYIVIVNGVKYVTSVEKDYLSNMSMYATFLGSAPWNVSNEGYSPISLYISGGSYPDISSSEVELSFTCKDFDNNNDYSIEVYLESSDYAIIPLDEKFLPDVAKNAVQYVEQTLSLTKQMQARNNIGAMHNPTAANIGQLIRVSSIDENGRPTDWEPFDFYLSLVSPDGTEWAMDVTDNGELTLSKDDTFREILEGTITNIKSDAIKIGTRIFYGCTELTTADFSLASNIDTYAFYGCSNLSTFILRNKNTMCTLVSTTAFTSTPIASGTGYIYVPSILVDSYKTATNWSEYANQFRAIEDYPDIFGGEM